MKAQYVNDPDKGPGHGFLHITNAEMLQDLEGVCFCIRRGSDQWSIGPGGWQASEEYLLPTGIFLLDEGFALGVGPAVVDSLDSQENYRLTVRAANGMNLMAGLRVPEVAYSPLSGGQGIGATASPPPSLKRPAPPIPPPPAPEPAPAEPEPAETEGERLLMEPELPPPPDMEMPVPAPEKRSPVAAILSGLIFLALLGAGGYFLWKQMNDKTVPATNATASPQAAAPAANATSPAPPQSAPALAQARAHLSGGADPGESVKLAAKLHADKEGADAAFLLLEDAAAKGNAPAMLSVGKFYDPTDAGPHGTIIKDPLEAYAWYAKASAAGNPDAAARLAALRAWAEAESAKGNAVARETLSKFAK